MEVRVETDGDAEQEWRDIFPDRHPSTFSSFGTLMKAYPHGLLSGVSMSRLERHWNTHRRNAAQPAP